MKYIKAFLISARIPVLQGLVAGAATGALSGVLTGADIFRFALAGSIGCAVGVGIACGIIGALHADLVLGTFSEHDE